MSGFLAFLDKEFREILRTWRIWVLPGILLVMGITSPALAALAPRIVESVTSGQPDVVIEMPDPDWVDAYLQYAQQLQQIVLLALIIVTAGLVSGERRSGTAILVLTKPVSRAAFIAAKFIAQTALVAGAMVPATLGCWLLTLAIFEDAPAGKLIESSLIFLVLAVLFIAITLLFSTLVNSQAGAAGLGLLAFLVITILSAIGPTREYTPAGLFNAVGAVISEPDVAILIPLLTGLLATALFLALTILLFTRQEQSGRMGAG